MEDIKMGFFSELKSDLSQAVNTLMPEDKPEATSLDNDKAREENRGPLDLEGMLDRLDDIRIDDGPMPEEFQDNTEQPLGETVRQESERELDDSYDGLAVKEEEPVAETRPEDLEVRIEEQTMEELSVEEPRTAIEAINPSHIDRYVEKTNEQTDKYNKNGGFAAMDFESQTPTDELASITEGMVLKGDIATTGSLDLMGKITGNIKCLGKLNVTGEINGDSDAAEIYAESARITGEVKSKGSVKVGQSTVIVGNIFGSSAVIAGAVKGDIDVHGPVVLDTTAIVMGNIKSQSVQINNGAVIEGMCSQSYADVNPSEFFEGLKNK